MTDISDGELERVARQLGLTAILELDREAFREAMATAEALRTSIRRPASVIEEPAHVARPAGDANAGD